MNTSLFIGKYSRKRRKSSHFLVVHFDNDQDNSNPGGYSYSGDDSSIHFSTARINQPNRYGESNFSFSSLLAKFLNKNFENLKFT